jgi:hypothetical protein
MWMPFARTEKPIPSEGKRLYKLAGLNLIITYALIAIIGDIERFATLSRLTSPARGASLFAVALWVRCHLFVTTPSDSC